MTDIATLGIKVTSDGIDKASSGLNKLTSEGGKAEAATSKLSSSFDGLNKYMQAAQGAFAALGMGVFVKQALDAALAMERINSAMKATAGTAAATARELAFVREESQRLGLEFRSTAEAYAKFSAASKGTSIEGEGVRKIFKGVSEAATAMRLTTEQSNGVFLALQQMMSKGTVQAEELRGQLAERLPGAFGMAAKAMGMTTRELGKQLELGKVLSSDLLPKLAEEMHKTYGTAAIEAATGGQAAINRFKNSVFESASALGTALMPAFTGILNILTPLMDYLKMFIGGIEILAVKLATLPDKAAAAWRVIKSGEGLFSTAGMAMYVKEKAVSDAAAEAAIADIMKKYMPVSAAKTAAEMAEEQSKVAAALAKEAGGRIVTGLKTGLTSVQKEHQEQIKSFLKESWDNASIELAAEDFSKDAYSKMGMFSAKPTGFTKNPALSLGVDLQIKSVEQLNALNKDQLELLQRQRKELEYQQAIIKYIADLEASNSATEASMVGMNSVGGFDSIEDQTANQMAIQKDAHESRLYMIEIEQQANIDKMQSDELAIKTMMALDKKAALEKQKNTIATASIADKSLKSQLSMTAAYAGGAATLLQSLASTQDQTSRKGFETAQAFNLAAAVMSTAAGIMNQYSSGDPYTANFRAAIVAGVGAIQVAEIASTTFGGGSGSVSAPSGSFGASGGGGSSLTNVSVPMQSIEDRQSVATNMLLIETIDRNSVVIGKLAKSIESLYATFEAGGKGVGLANNAPGMFTKLDDSGSGAMSFFKTEAKNLLTPAFLNAGDFLKTFTGITSLKFAANAISGKWKTTGGGMDINMSGGDADVQDYTTSEKKRLGRSTKYSTTYSQNEDASTYLDALMDPYIADLGTMATTLGLSFDPANYIAATKRIATAGKTSEQIGKELGELMEQTLSGMALTIGELGDYIGVYEDAYERIKAINNAWVSTNAQLQLVGIKALDIGIKTAIAAENAQNSFYGGMEGYTKAMSDYREVMYTESELAAQDAAAAQRAINSAWVSVHAETGLIMPKTIAGWNALRASIDPNSALFASLTQLGPAFAIVANQAEEIAAAFSESIKTISQSASDAIRGILNSTLSTESPEARYARAQREFMYATPEMAGELGKSLLDASRSMFASGDGYISDYTNVMDELTALAGLDTTVDPNASTVAEIKTLKAAIVDLQTAIVEKLTMIESPLVRVAANI